MRAWLLLVCLAACGDDGAGATVDAPPSTIDAPLVADAPGPPSVPTTPGSATITGTIQGETFQPTTAFYYLHPIGGHDVLVLKEGGQACETEAGTGQTVVLGFPCGPAAAGTLESPVDLENASCTPTPYIWTLVEGFTGEESEYLATAASVTVTSASPSITGTFTATVDGSTIAGAFNAVDCP